MKKGISVFTLALSLVMGFGLAVPIPARARAASAGERHPDIRKAIAACELAANDLEDAAHDFCGHREAALDATLTAIGQMELAIACDPGSSTSQSMAMSLRSASADLALAAQSAGAEHHPYIRKALAALNIAAIDLEDAAHDFCGHRVDALNAVNAAINQLELAISCDQ